MAAKPLLSDSEATKLFGEKDYLASSLFSGKRTKEINLNDNDKLKGSYQAIPQDRSHSSIASIAKKAVGGFPGLLIACFLNLFFGVSFGQAFFPARYKFYHFLS